MDQELGDEHWELIAPLLPKPKGRGRPRAEDRRTLGRHSAKIPQHSGCPRQTGLEPSLPGWQFRAQQKGGEAIA